MLLPQGSDVSLLNCLSDPECGITIAGDTPCLDSLPTGDLFHLALSALPKRRRPCVLSLIGADRSLWQDWREITAGSRQLKTLSFFLDDLIRATIATSFYCISSIFFSIHVFSFHQFLKLTLYPFLSPAVSIPTWNDSTLLNQASGFLPSLATASQRTKFTMSWRSRAFSLTQKTNTCKLELFIVDWGHVVILSRGEMCLLIRSLWKEFLYLEE